MPLEWNGSFWRLLKTRSAFSSKAISWRPSRRMRLVARMRSSAAGIDVGIDLVRPFAFEAQQHRLVGAVAAAGQRQRAEQLAAHARHALEHPVFRQPVLDEARGRRASARPCARKTADADLEEVENADGHGLGSRLRGVAAILRPTATDPIHRACPTSSSSSATTATSATRRSRCWRRRACRNSLPSGSMTTTRSRRTLRRSRAGARRADGHGAGLAVRCGGGEGVRGMNRLSPTACAPVQTWPKWLVFDVLFTQAFQDFLARFAQDRIAVKPGDDVGDGALGAVFAPGFPAMR